MIGSELRPPRGLSSVDYLEALGRMIPLPSTGLFLAIEGSEVKGWILSYSGGDETEIVQEHGEGEILERIRGMIRQWAMANGSLRMVTKRLIGETPPMSPWKLARLVYEIPLEDEDEDDNEETST